MASNSASSTHGVTPTLKSASKVAITLLMFAGRVGSLSVAMALVERGEGAIAGVDLSVEEGELRLSYM